MTEAAIHPIYFVKGDDLALRTGAVASLIGRLVDPSFRDFDLQRLDGRSVTRDQILAAALAVPFGSGRKVTIIEDADRLQSDMVEQLQARLKGGMGDQATLIFVAGDPERGRSEERGEKPRRGAGSRLESWARAMGAVISLGSLNWRDADAWIARAAEGYGLRMEAAARRELLARVGLHPGVLDREVEKLGAFCTDGAVTAEAVRAVTPESAEYSVFALVDAVSEGKAVLAIRVLHGLRERNEPAPRIMALLATQLRLVWQAKMLIQDRGAVDRLARDPDLLKRPPFVQTKARNQARCYSWNRLRAGFRLLLEKDLAFKGIEGSIMDADEAMETLVLAMCAREPAP